MYSRLLKLVLAALALAGPWRPAGASTVPFGPQTVISGAAGPQSVFAADVDGDGDLDVLSASQPIAWYENNGASPPSWTVHVISTTASDARSVFAADVDGDGDLDALSALRGDNKVAWYENTGGSPPAWTERTISNAAGPQSVFAADVDGDGDTDVLSASADDDKIAWYENNGASPPGWTARVISTTANDARSVFAADVDGDGDLDTLSASSADNKIAWYENNGASPPTWTERVISTAASGAASVFATDVDGDGDTDVLSASLDAHMIAWYENDGASPPSWTARVISTDAPNAWSVFAADVDGDGDTDALSASLADDTIAWYENSGASPPSWTKRTISTTADFARSVFAADMDGDGDVDVLSASELDAKIAWYENKTIHRSAAFPGQTVITAAADGSYSVFAADVDGDGDRDVLSASFFDDTIAWYENDGARSPVFTARTIATNANGARSVFAADVDGDGDTDVLSGSSFDRRIAWYENNGASPPGFTTRTIDFNMNGANSVFAADVDGDGDMDVLASAEIEDKVAWYENNGASPPGWTIRTIAIADIAFGVFAADVDGDGDMDALASAGSMIAWYENNGASPPIWTARTIATGLQGRSVFAADMDRDGDTDVLATTGSLDRVAWYENDGGSPPSFTSHRISSAGVFVESVVAADLDADGDLDALSCEHQANVVRWHENTSGDGSTWVDRTLPMSTASPFSVFAADVDGDGDADALSASSDDDKVAWYENQGGQFRLGTSDTAPSTLIQGATDDVLRIVAAHKGRPGDTDAELATLELRLQEGPGDDLTSAEANALIENLFVYLDNGSGVFESGSDTLVQTVSTLALVEGRETVAFTDGDPNVRVVQATPRTYFVVVQTTADAASRTPNRFRVTHVTQSSSTAEDRDYDLPLSLEFEPNVFSGIVITQGPGAPFVTAVLPADNALGVSASTNVYVVFSEAVDPATVDSSTFRLLDGGGSPVAAGMSLPPSGLQATLDPTAALSFDTIYTMQVTSGVTDLTGGAAVPFTSRFRTGAAPMDTPLPTVSEEAVPPQNPLVTSLAAGGPPPPRMGWSVAATGDLNLDGFGDLVAGVPGLQVDLINVCNPGQPNACRPCTSDSQCGGVLGACNRSGQVACSLPEAGAAVVYLGGSTETARTGPDIIFRGESAHDRVGVAAAGNFDFNGDGRPDILIGAEQVNRSGTNDAGCNDGASCGNGKVYLIYFNPANYDLGNPAADVVSLGRVGVDIPGVTFTGVSLGDRTGFAVAGGGRVGVGGGPSILIGAPGRNAGAGAGYLVLNNPSLTGAVSLSQVGTGVAGFAFQGTAAGDTLGHAVAFPGDVTGTAGEDLVLGAPLADPPTQIDSGIAYVVEGGSLTSLAAPIPASSIGGIVAGVQIRGDQDFERLGWALAGGGDNRVDGKADLLIGAPFFDPGGQAAAGRVIQASARLAGPAIAASTVGSTVDGVIWRGAAGGDRLGWSLSGVRDVTGNNWDDIVLGAPYSDSGGMQDAGAVYLIEGRTSGTAAGGTLSVGVVQGTVAGLRLVGVEPGEHAGYSIAGTGDLDADAKSDYAVGAPDRTFNGEASAGTVYMVLESIPEAPGNCDERGCTIADLATGAQIQVPPGSLPGPVAMAVAGVLDPASLAAQNMAVPAGKLLAGATDFDLEGQTFTGTDPTASIPTRSEAESQVQDTTTEPVWFFDVLAGWVPLGRTGSVGSNPYYPTRKSVGLAVDELHVYAVFLNDADGDGMRDELDCRPSDRTVFAAPGEARNVEFVTPTSLSWTSLAAGAGTGTVYDVLRGVLGQFPVGTGAGETCLADGVAGTTLEASPAPATGQGFYYLVRGTNLCGIGTYGSATSGAERTSAACP